MADDNNGATPAQAATPPSVPAANTPATPETPAGNQDPKGDSPATVTIALKDWEATQRDAGRWRSKKNATPAKEDRYATPPEPGEPDEQVSKLQGELSVYQRENLQLKLQSQVRDLLEKDEYKSLPESTKKILRQNPLAIVDPRAKDINDAVADIEDWLDEAVAVSPGVETPTVPGQPVVEQTQETPPVNGAAPNPTGTGVEESIEGKTGPARSTAILKNIFRAGSAKQ